MTTHSVLTITNAPTLVASAYLPLVSVKNTGTAMVRAVTQGADNGREIAAGQTVEFEMAGRLSNLSLVADSSTTVEVSRYTVEALRAAAADEFRVPVELIHGRTKAEIGDSVVRFLGHEAGPATQDGTSA